jgi:hypothetical protein
MCGTIVLLDNVDDTSVEEAKGFCLRFTGERVIEDTKFGQILQRSADRPARIYVNGLSVAEEPDFAFSYNVTALTRTMRKALNRERTNVGRTAYLSRGDARRLQPTAVDHERRGEVMSCAGKLVGEEIIGVWLNLPHLTEEVREQPARRRV